MRPLLLSAGHPHEESTHGYGQIDPARLDGDALTQWYLRSPDDIEQERQAAAAQRYADFFDNTSQPAGEDDSTSANPASTATGGAPFDQGGLRAAGYGGGFDDGVYRPGQDNAEITPTAAATAAVAAALPHFPTVLGWPSA